MVLFDVTDPPLYIAKMCKYIANSNDHNKFFWNTMADCAFSIFAVSFFLTRILISGYIMYLYILHIIQSNNVGLTLESICALSGIIMYGLQWIWQVAIIRIINRVLIGNGLTDNRSDSDGDN